jgi:hypothetical protein
LIGIALDGWNDSVKFVAISMLAIVGFGIVALGACVAVSMCVNQTTAYCPWKHEISDTACCVVLDENNDGALIQHGDLDINVYYLELVSGGTSRYYAFPESVQQLAPRGYSAKIISNRGGLILLDGQEHQLTALDVDPCW